ncbi:MAG: NUDIX hydrolase [Natronospirillum sp.]|uniref:NUDIX hydrolase n=1 Tax=Natronospirillum sp. TaxID=2812955 RepID=UPI0026014BD6|nr:NUDIX hydrolase [Natronospirillum sp.]MCH8551055.1 NUDIX hydrolase [Natronospirillum sp.]
MTFQPHITVAALVRRKDRYLIVEEVYDGRKVYNQPAGHVESGETIVAACLRETLEESRWQIRASHLVGVYVYEAPNGTTYYRFGLAAEALEETGNPLDQDVVAVHWLTLKEIKALHHRGELRSPLVLKLIEDDLAGQAYPLSLIHENNYG